jgi:hypothetical protein
LRETADLQHKGDKKKDQKILILYASQLIPITSVSLEGQSHDQLQINETDSLCDVNGIIKPLSKISCHVNIANSKVVSTLDK